MQEPTSTEERSFDDRHFPAKNLALKGERAALTMRTGLSSCGMLTPATLPGNNFCTISANSTITAPGVQKSIEELYAKVLRSCKASCCVAPVADAWAFGISAMALC